MSEQTTQTAAQTPTQPRFFAVREDVLLATIQYLSKRPLEEVETVVAVLRQSELITITGRTNPDEAQTSVKKKTKSGQASLVN